MEIGNQEFVYCADDEEYKVYCKKCDKLRMERFLKKCLKSQSHTISFRKRKKMISDHLIHINMSYYCEVCCRFVKPTCKYELFKSIIHKELDKCKHIKLTFKNPDIHSIDRAFYEYIIQHNKNMIKISL